MNWEIKWIYIETEGISSRVILRRVWTQDTWYISLSPNEEITILSAILPYFSVSEMFIFFIIWLILESGCNLRSIGSILHLMRYGSSSWKAEVSHFLHIIGIQELVNFGGQKTFSSSSGEISFVDIFIYNLVCKWRSLGHSRSKLRKLRLRVHVAGWRQSRIGVHAWPGGSTRGGLSYCMSEPTPCRARLCKANPTFALKCPSIRALAELPNKWGEVPGKFSLKWGDQWNLTQ